MSLSLFFAILKGPYDSLLQWPFVCPVTMTLLEQVADLSVREPRDVTMTFVPNPRPDNMPFLGKPEEAKNLSLGQWYTMSVCLTLHVDVCVYMHVSVSVGLYLCVSVSVCIPFGYACVYLCMPVSLCVCPCLYVYACVYLRMPVSLCVCSCLYVYACVCLCMPVSLCVCLYPFCVCLGLYVYVFALTLRLLLRP